MSAVTTETVLVNEAITATVDDGVAGLLRRRNALFISSTLNQTVTLQPFYRRSEADGWVQLGATISVPAGSSDINVSHEVLGALVGEVKVTVTVSVTPPTAGNLLVTVQSSTGT